MSRSVSVAMVTLGLAASAIGCSGSDGGTGASDAGGDGVGFDVTGNLSPFCAAVDDYDKRCLGNCNPGAGIGCGLLESGLSDQAKSVYVDCEKSGACGPSPTESGPVETCFSDGLKALAPTDAQKALADAYCKTCGPTDPSCADTFLHDPTLVTILRAASDSSLHTMESCVPKPGSSCDTLSFAICAAFANPGLAMTGHCTAKDGGTDG